MLIDTFTNKDDGIESRIIQRDTDHKYVVQFWDIDADEMLPSIHVTPFLDLARKKARAFVDGVPVGGSIPVW